MKLQSVQRQILFWVLSFLTYNAGVIGCSPELTPTESAIDTSEPMDGAASKNDRQAWPGADELALSVKRARLLLPNGIQFPPPDGGAVFLLEEEEVPPTVGKAPWQHRYPRIYKYWRAKSSEPNTQIHDIGIARAPGAASWPRMAGLSGCRTYAGLTTSDPGPFAAPNSYTEVYDNGGCPQDFPYPAPMTATSLGGLDHMNVDGAPNPNSLVLTWNSFRPGPDIKWRATGSIIVTAENDAAGTVTIRAIDWGLGTLVGVCEGGGRKLAHVNRWNVGT